MIRYYFEHPYHSASSESLRPVINLSTQFKITFQCRSVIKVYPNRPKRNNASRYIAMTNDISRLSGLRLRHQFAQDDLSNNPGLDLPTVQTPIVDLFQPLPLAARIDEDTVDYNAAMLYPMQ